MDTDPTTTNPEFYRTLWENDDVRVLEYVDRPGEETTPHAHPNTVMVTLTDFDRRLTSGDQSRDVTLAAGSAIWAMFAHDWYVSLLPGGALTVLVYAAYGTATSPEQLALALGSLLAWAAIPALIAYKTFRWEPRH